MVLIVTLGAMTKANIIDITVKTETINSDIFAAYSISIAYRNEQNHYFKTVDTQLNTDRALSTVTKTAERAHSIQ